MGRWGDRELRSEPLHLEISTASSDAARAAMAARYHLALGRPEGALEALEPALAARPELALLHGLRGEALEARGDLRAALAAYRRAATLADRESPGLDEPPFYRGRVDDLIRRLQEPENGA